MNVQQTMEDVLRPAPTQWGVLRVPAQQDLHWLQMVALVLILTSASRARQVASSSAPIQWVASSVAVGLDTVSTLMPGHAEILTSAAQTMVTVNKFATMRWEVSRVAVDLDIHWHQIDKAALI
jgi:hypothetical protein